MSAIICAVNRRGNAAKLRKTRDIIMRGNIVTSALLVILTAISVFIIFCYKEEQKELKREEAKQKLVRHKQELLKQKLAAVLEERKLLSDMPHILVFRDNENILTKNLIGDMPEVKLSCITAESDRNDLCNFVVIGIETTGTALNRSKIVELSAIRFRGFKPVEIFTTLINPKRPIPEKSVKINGITSEMVKDAPLLQQVSNRFIGFVGDSAIVSHDIVFVLRHLFYNGIDLRRNKKYCTRTLAKNVIPKNDIDDYTLAALCEYYGITIVQLHRSEYEALATGRLFEKLACGIISE